MLSPSQANSMSSLPSPTRRLIKFTGTLNGRPCAFMLDSGATGNFVSVSFVKKHSFPTSPLPRQDVVTLADGSTQTTGSMVPAAAVQIGSYADRVDFVSLPLAGYDVILGMPWLYHYNPVVNWQLELLTFVQLCKGSQLKRVLKATPPVQLVRRRPSASSVPSAASSPAASSPSKAASSAATTSSAAVAARVSFDTSTRLSVNLLGSKALRRDIRRGLVEQVTLLRQTDLDFLATAAQVPSPSVATPWSSDSSLRPPSSSPSHPMLGIHEAFRRGQRVCAADLTEAIQSSAQLEPLMRARRQMLAEFKDVFPEKLPDGLPPARSVDHKIDLVPGSSPPSRPTIRLSATELAELKKQLTELEEAGFIQPSKSPYGAPILFVKKKSGEMRMCVDYRASP